MLDDGLYCSNMVAARSVTRESWQRAHGVDSSTFKYKGRQQASHCLLGL